MKTKHSQLKDIVEELSSIELYDAGLNDIKTILVKAKSRIDEVTSTVAEGDSQEIINKLKNSSSQLDSVINTLSDIQRIKDGE